MEENKAIVPYDKELSELTTPTDEDFYTVKSRGKDKKIASARILQVWANKQHISTEIKQVVKNDEYAQAIIHGWVGDKEHPIMETEEVVTITFMDYEREWLINNLRTHRAVYSEDKKTFVPADMQATIDLLKYIARKKMFADREAVTKAQSRIYRKLLGAEWREEEEKEAEKEEVETVQDSIKNQPTTNGASERQINHIKDLTANNNGKADIAREFLQVLGKDFLSQLSSTEASELITKLKA